MIAINVASMRKSWSVMKGFVSSTFLMLPKCITAVGEINRRSIQARIPIETDLPFGLEIESNGFTALVNRYDVLHYDTERNLFVTSDGEFSIVVKQDTDGILAQMSEMAESEESEAIDISPILPTLGSMVSVMATSTRAMLFAKDDILTTTDGKRCIYSFIPELSAWNSSEVKALPGELMMLARRATACLISYTDEAIIADIDGCRIYQERIEPSEFGVGNTITKRDWLSGHRKDTGNFKVDSSVFSDGVKFVSGFVEKTGKVVPKITVTIKEKEILLVSGKGKKSIPVSEVSPNLVGTRFAANLEFLLETLAHMDGSEMVISLKSNGVGAIVFDQLDEKKAAVLMTFTSVED